MLDAPGPGHGRDVATAMRLPTDPAAAEAPSPRRDGPPPIPVAGAAARRLRDPVAVPGPGPVAGAVPGPDPVAGPVSGPTAPPPIPPRRPRGSAPPAGGGLAGGGAPGGGLAGGGAPGGGLAGGLQGGSLDGGSPPPLSPPGTALDFRTVYEGHFDFVWRSVRRLGVHERWLDDAVQDVFIVVHRRLAEFEGRSTLKSWLFGIARRVAHDHRRRAGRKERGDSLPDGLIDPQAASPADDLQRSRALQVLHEILETMDDDKREVFILAELEQMTVPEIAAATDANLNTVYSRLRAARQTFDAAVARHQARERRSP